MSLSDYELRLLDELGAALARSDPRLARVLTGQPSSWRGSRRLRTGSGGEGSRPAAQAGRRWVRWLVALLVVASTALMLCGVILARTPLIDAGVVTTMCSSLIFAGTRQGGRQVG